MKSTPDILADWPPAPLDPAAAEKFVQDSLANLTTELHEYTAPNYPTRSERFYADDPVITIPHGVWDTGEVLPSSPSAVDGYEHDTFGRPLHPWLTPMVTCPELGVAAGRGQLYHWGPNYTEDAYITANNHVIMVTRQDTGRLAAPGGYRDTGELPLVAASRETTEEVGLTLPTDCKPQVIYDGPVADVRMTAHAWQHTTAVLFDLGTCVTLPALNPDLVETNGADWLPIHEVLSGEHGKLYGSHRSMLLLALGRLGVELRE